MHNPYSQYKAREGTILYNFDPLLAHVAHIRDADAKARPQLVIGPQPLVSDHEAVLREVEAQSWSSPAMLEDLNRTSLGFDWIERAIRKRTEAYLSDMKVMHDKDVPGFFTALLS